MVSIARAVGIVQSPVCSRRIDEQFFELDAMAAAYDKDQVSDIDGADPGEAEGMCVGQQRGGAWVRGG